MLMLSLSLGWLRQAPLRMSATTSATVRRRTALASFCAARMIVTVLGTALRWEAQQKPPLVGGGRAAGGFSAVCGGIACTTALSRNRLQQLQAAVANASSINFQ